MMWSTLVLSLLGTTINFRKISFVNLSHPSRRNIDGGGERKNRGERIMPEIVTAIVVASVLDRLNVDRLQSRPPMPTRDSVDVPRLITVHPNI